MKNRVGYQGRVFRFVRNFLSSKGFLKNSEDSYSAFSCEGSSEFLSKSLQHLLSSLKTCTEVFTTLSCREHVLFADLSRRVFRVSFTKSFRDFGRRMNSSCRRMDASEEPLGSFPEEDDAGAGSYTAL